MDEAELIRSMQKHDNRNAFAFIVRTYQSRIRGYLRRLVNGDFETADELAQETFLKAYRNISSYKFEAKFSTWLFVIARNTYLDWLKSQRTIENGEGDLNVIGEMNCDGRLDLEKAIGRLSRQERELLSLCYVNGMTHQEVSAITGHPLGTVKTSLLRTKEKLGEMMGV